MEEPCLKRLTQQQFLLAPFKNGVYTQLTAPAITLSLLKWEVLYYVKLHSLDVSLLSLSKLKIDILCHFMVTLYIDTDFNLTS